MANEISKLITPDGVSHDIADAVARQASYDVSNKVNKTGDTMTGDLTLAGRELRLGTSSASSNDSGDIVWYYGNGQEKARIWTGDTPTSYAESRPNFRSYKSDGSALHNTQLATASDVDAKISRSGDVMTGALVALAFTASANGSPTIVSQSTDVDVSKADNNISSDRYPAWVASDKYGRILTRMECVASSNGNIAAYWYVRNYNTSGSTVAQKGIKITMAKDGSITYAVDDAAKFRSAIGHPFEWDINTKNTTDTWVPVMTGSTMQHRVLSASLNEKSVVGATSSLHNLPSWSNDVIPSTQYLAYWNGAYNSSGNSNLQRCDRGRFGTVVTKNADGMWDHSSSSYQSANSILCASNDGTAIDVSNLRSRFWSWTSNIYIDCRTNRAAAGIVYVFNGNNTEIIRIYCGGNPSSWNVQRLGDSSMSNCTWEAANVTIGSDTYARLHIYGGGQRTFWAIYGVSDKWQH